MARLDRGPEGAHDGNHRQDHHGGVSSGVAQPVRKEGTDKVDREVEDRVEHGVAAHAPGAPSGSLASPDRSSGSPGSARGAAGPPGRRETTAPEIRATAEPSLRPASR